MNSAVPHTTVNRLDYQPSPYWVDDVWLQFDLDPSSTRVRSRLSVRSNPDAPSADGSWWLDGESLDLLGVRVDGQPLTPASWRQTEQGLLLTGLPDAFELEIDTRISPESNTALSGLYISNGVFCTQCEAEGFRRITYFPDRPDVLARYRVVIRAEKANCPVLLSNGNPISTRAIDQRRIEAVWDDPHPKPSYLFALVAGDLGCRSDTFTTRDGQHVDLNIFTVPEQVDQTAHAMVSLKKSMRWDEERFGLVYDLDVFNIVAVDDFNMGAMENKGLNIFNTKYILTDAETATDTDFLGVESVVAHEYFHNWTGNRITCRDWFQLSLKEGLTVFRDQEFSSDQHVRALKRIEDVRLLKARQFPEDAGPMAHPIRPESYVEINNFYTLTVYEKGAEVVRLYHTLLGESAFQEGMKTYVARHDGTAATCDDFRFAMADASGVNLDQFERWYTQAGTPEITVETAFDPDTQLFTLTLGQSTPDTPGQQDKPPLVIPVRMGLLSAEGEELLLRQEGVDQSVTELTLVLDQPQQSFVFTGIQALPVLSLMRGFSAPVIMRHAQSDADKLVLMQHDTDAFNRWQAAQDLLAEQVRRNARSDRTDSQPVVPESFVEALKQFLADSDTPAGLRAETLALPHIETVAALMSEIDVDALDNGLNAVKCALGNALASELDAYIALPDSKEFSLHSQAMGLRALRGLCLDWRFSAQPHDLLQAVSDLYINANNMTDRLNALRIVVHSDSPASDTLRAELLADFEKRFADNKLVMDKWYALQASSPRSTVLDDLASLRKRADFDLRNPNRARSLVGAFAFNNPVRFHAIDGSGYRYLTDFVAEYDSINPQMSARLLGALSNWRRHTAERQSQARDALTRLLQKDGLSRDVWEIASKSLHGE